MQNLSTDFVALARQNARSDRVCLDFFFGYFLLIKQKKVTIKSYEERSISGERT